MTVMRPLMRYSITNAYPLEWTPGRDLHGRLFLFGFVPLGTHVIGIEGVDEAQRQILTRESGAVARCWRHRIVVRSVGPGKTAYSDTIDIQAGLLTPILWLFAHLFYRHRHCRWKRLLRQA